MSPEALFQLCDSHATLRAACEAALDIFKDIFEPCEPDCDCIIHTLDAAIAKATEPRKE